ncbi:MAG: hypothetical protein HC902_02815 [Calothrix sp. SM1_5_4]|nr:hypothetical protein [Calothrix sp. SM1_5_4]
MNLESYEWGTFYDDVKKGRFQIATMKWVGIADPDIYRAAFHSREKPPGGRNRGGFENPTLDRLLDSAEREGDPRRRRELFNQAQRIVQEDFAIIPLWYDEQVAVARKNILDYRPSITSDFKPFADIRKVASP